MNAHNKPTFIFTGSSFWSGGVSMSQPPKKPEPSGASNIDPIVLDHSSQETTESVEDGDGHPNKAREEV